MGHTSKPQKHNSIVMFCWGCPLMVVRRHQSVLSGENSSIELTVIVVSGRVFDNLDLVDSSGLQCNGCPKRSGGHNFWFLGFLCCMIVSLTGFPYKYTYKQRVVLQIYSFETVLAC